MLVLSMLFQIHRRHEAFRALDALVASFHQVDLRLGVSVQVRLSHALVVAQTTHVLADPCNGNCFCTLTSVVVCRYVFEYMYRMFKTKAKAKTTTFCLRAVLEIEDSVLEDPIAGSSSY